MKFLRNLVRVLALPVSIAAFVGGIYGWSFWWFFGLSVVTGVALADQRLGIDDPLDVRNFIPGKRKDDWIAGAFAFGGSVAGFGLMYFLGSLFA